MKLPWALVMVLAGYFGACEASAAECKSPFDPGGLYHAHYDETIRAHVYDIDVYELWEKYSKFKKSGCGNKTGLDVAEQRISRLKELTALREKYPAWTFYYEFSPSNGISRLIGKGEKVDPKVVMRLRWWDEEWKASGVVSRWTVFRSPHFKVPIVIRGKYLEGTQLMKVAKFLRFTRTRTITLVTGAQKMAVEAVPWKP